METNNFDPILNPTAKKNLEENLEISSTGYGLESIQKVKRSKQSSKNKK